MYSKKIYRCPKCKTGTLEVTYNRTTHEPFLICSNGYECYHGDIPYGHTEEDYDLYTPNFNEAHYEWMRKKLNESD